MTDTNNFARGTYDDKGVECVYSKTFGWFPLEDTCLECGYRVDECECEGDCGYRPAQLSESNRSVLEEMMETGATDEEVDEMYLALGGIELQDSLLFPNPTLKEIMKFVFQINTKKIPLEESVRVIDHFIFLKGMGDWGKMRIENELELYLIVIRESSADREKKMKNITAFLEAMTHLDCSVIFKHMLDTKPSDVVCWERIIETRKEFKQRCEKAQLTAENKLHLVSPLVKPLTTDDGFHCFNNDDFRKCIKSLFKWGELYSYSIKECEHFWKTKKESRQHYGHIHLHFKNDELKQTKERAFEFSKLSNMKAMMEWIVPQIIEDVNYTKEHLLNTYTEC